MSSLTKDYLCDFSNFCKLKVSKENIYIYVVQRIVTTEDRQDVKHYV